jgi:hypothetical protein
MRILGSLNTIKDFFIVEAVFVKLISCAILAWHWIKSLEFYYLDNRIYILHKRLIRFFGKNTLQFFFCWQYTFQLTFRFSLNQLWFRLTEVLLLKWRIINTQFIFKIMFLGSSIHFCLVLIASSAIIQKFLCSFFGLIALLFGVSLSI